MTYQSRVGPAGAPTLLHERWGRLRLLVISACIAVVGLLSGCTTSNPTGPTPTGTVAVSPQPTQRPISRALPGTTPIGAKWDWPRYNVFAPYLGTMTGGFTTYEVVWCNIEAEPGRWRWADVDKVVEQTRAMGISVGLKLRVGACWATTSGAINVRGKRGKTESVPPTDMTQYETFIRRAVKRYAPLGVHEWAIENETNSDAMWRGTIDEYVQLAQTASKNIHRIDPDAVVVDPGLSSSTDGIGVVAWLLDQGRADQALAAYNTYFARRTQSRDQLPPAASLPALRAIMADSKATSALAWLEMDRRLLQEGVFDVRQVHFYETWVNVPVLMAWLSTQDPPRTPVEVWEVGQYWIDSTATDQSRAEEAVKTLVLFLGSGARRVVWLPLSYNPDGRNADEPRYGLVDPNGTVRPAGAAVADLTALARGADVTPVSRSGVQGVILTRGDVSSLILWTISGSHTFDLSGLDDVTDRTLGGPALSSAPLTIGSEPVVITATATSADLMERLK
jgi:hypothetical protein